jgi:hypothetical protein
MEKFQFFNQDTVAFLANIMTYNILILKEGIMLKSRKELCSCD